jgi:flagellum-specific peptidoglycan hydrolase FlgJ
MINVNPLNLGRGVDFGLLQPLPQPKFGNFGGSFLEGQKMAQDQQMNQQTMQMRDMQMKELHQKMGTQNLELINKLTGSIQQVPDEQKPAAWQAALTQAKNAGLDISTVPQQWGPEADAYSKTAFNVTGDALKWGLLQTKQGKNTSTPFDKAMAQQDAKNVESARDSAKQADTVLNQLDILKTNAPDADLGVGSGFTGFMNKLPIIGDSKKAQANEAIDQQSNTLALANRKEMPGSMSDADREFLVATVPRRGLTPEQFNYSVQVQQKGWERVKEYQSAKIQWAEDHGGLKGFQAAWDKYSKENPLFPQAQRKDNVGQPPAAQQAPTPISEDDINATAKKHGMTPDQVRAKLQAHGVNISPTSSLTAPTKLASNMIMGPDTMTPEQVDQSPNAMPEKNPPAMGPNSMPVASPDDVGGTDTNLAALAPTPKARVSQVVEAAQKTYKDNPVVGDLAAAQAILESRLLGQPSKLASNYNNLFGIKKAGTAGVVKMNSPEEENGVMRTRLSGFGRNNSIADSFLQHRDVLSNPRYAAVWTAKTFEDAAKAIKRAGYATDSGYARKLINIYKNYILPAKQTNLARS